jgi:hypothetical protein
VAQLPSPPDAKDVFEALSKVGYILSLLPDAAAQANESIAAYKDDYDKWEAELRRLQEGK